MLICLVCMSLECIVIVLMNNSPLGGQECTDSVNVEQDGDTIDEDTTAIIPRLNFTCNGRITRIRARVAFDRNRDQYPFFQVWRAASVGSTIYNKINEVEQPRGVTSFLGIATFDLTNAIEVQSGDVVGYYHPSDARFRVRTIQTDGYILDQFTGSHESVDLNNNNGRGDGQQPLIQFTIGEC